MCFGFNYKCHRKPGETSVLARPAVPAGNSTVVAGVSMGIGVGVSVSVGVVDTLYGTHSTGGSVMEEKVLRFEVDETELASFHARNHTTVTSIVARAPSFVVARHCAARRLCANRNVRRLGAGIADVVARRITAKDIALAV